MIFEQCKVGRYFAWAGRDPGIKSPVLRRPKPDIVRLIKSF